AEVRLDSRQVGLALRIRELRNRDRGENADDHDDDQKFDEGEARLFRGHMIVCGFDNHQQLRIRRPVACHEGNAGAADILSHKLLFDNGLPCLGLSSRPARSAFSREFWHSARAVSPRYSFVSSQFAPVPTSTTSGTSSFTAVVISWTTSFCNSASSACGHSNTSSSCTCRSIWLLIFAAMSRSWILIIATLMRSAADPWIGEFCATRSPNARILKFRSFSSGI